LDVEEKNVSEERFTPPDRRFNQ